VFAFRALVACNGFGPLDCKCPKCWGYLFVVTRHKQLCMKHCTHFLPLSNASELVPCRISHLQFICLLCALCHLLLSQNSSSSCAMEKSFVLCLQYAHGPLCTNTILEAIAAVACRMKPEAPSIVAREHWLRKNEVGVM
jgi:hypothetical protein